MAQKLELGREYPPAGEAAVIQRIVDEMKAQYTQAHPTGCPMHNQPAPTKPSACPVAPRMLHAKSLGLLRIRWQNETASTLPAWLIKYLAGSVFAAGTKYDGWMRLSNGNGTPKNDGKDVHGMAIKLLGVIDPDGQTTTQDFLLADGQAFGCHTAADYIPLAAQKFPQFIFPSWNPFAWRYREAWLFGKALLKPAPHSPLEVPYWSQLPSKLGDLAVKHSVRPSFVPQVQVDPKDPNYLRHALVQQLKGDNLRGIVLEFFVQVQTDPVKMPVEDSRIVWSESASRPIKVATIYIPPQDFDTDERRRQDDSLSFNPAHTLAVHRPLGSISRVRMAVYKTLSEIRRGLNGDPLTEPGATSKTPS